MGDNSNIGFIVGDRCVAVFDTGGSPSVGKRLGATIASVTDLPICYVVLSHVHPDHIFGATSFISGQTKYLGHPNLPKQIIRRKSYYEEHLSEDLGAEEASQGIIDPSHINIVDHDMTLDLGGRTLEVRSWRASHTDHDLTAFDTLTETMWTGDLFFCEHIPVLDSNVKSFSVTIGELMSLRPRAFVPGHGRCKEGWDLGLKKQKKYLSVLERDAREAIKNNVSLMEAVNTVGWSERSKWANFDLFHRRNVTTAYTELEWED
jgi:quinoprotein relay system zinc metallohydrolase 2